LTIILLLFIAKLHLSPRNMFVSISALVLFLDAFVQDTKEIDT
jgi:hypothetical protein